MKVKIQVEDTVSEYLTYLEEAIADKGRTKHFLELWAEDFADIVNETIPKWNPNLMYSGLNPSFWKVAYEEGISKISILYTGFTGEGMGEPDDIQVWWEFGKYHKGGYSDILGRDYAYYQEYGVDKYAPSQKVQAPSFGGHHFIESGLYTFEEVMPYHVEEYLRAILNKQ